MYSIRRSSIGTNIGLTHISTNYYRHQDLNFKLIRHNPYKVDCIRLNCIRVTFHSVLSMFEPVARLIRLYGHTDVDGNSTLK